MPEILAISEQTTISEALLRLIASYSAFPSSVTAKNIFWQYMNDTECVGIYTMSGAVYLKRFITGSFEAQFPFCIRFKCKPTTNATRISKQSVLDALGEWIEKATYPPITEDREIQSITRTGTTFLAGNDDAGNEIYQCNFNLKYRKE